MKKCKDTIVLYIWKLNILLSDIHKNTWIKVSNELILIYCFE